MASRTVLGLDIGPNSIGWALLDEARNQVVATGVRVFPEGVDRDQTGGEQPKNQQRRIARGMRRQIARRARRKKVLRAALVQASLLPADSDEQRKLDALDPYVLRARGIRERLEPYEIGRLLVHLNQRRGFLSNRKTDRAKRKETSEMLKEISALAEQIGNKTLGEYLAEQRASAPLMRIRGHHTRRDMYQKEFERIWEFQRQFHPSLLTDALKYGRRGKPLDYPREPEPLCKRKGNSLLAEYGLHGILFFQRAMYWPSWVVGRCEYEPKEKRCKKADRAAQRFRLLQEVNNLRIIEQSGHVRALTPEQRTRVIAYLAEAKERTFDELRKQLGLLEGDGFNLEVGDRSKLHGMPTDYVLSRPSLFGKTWRKRSEEERTRIVRVLIDDHLSDDEKRRIAVEEWGCDAETAESLLEVDFEDGYASLSRAAIEKLLPHLERGLPMMSKDGSPSALSEAGYLRPDQRVVNEQERLPPVPSDIVNPLVRQALYEVRKLLNAIIREYGKPGAIHIELAREVQGSRESRQAQSRQMRARQRERDAAAERLREMGIKPTRDSIDQYLLWREQDGCCFYSGRPISQAQLFGGEVDVDHILPYSRSLDNSQSNKVLCFRSENRQKGQQTVWEWLAQTEPEKYQAVLQRAAKLPYAVRNAKRQKLLQQSVVLDDFVNRQLTDTAYVTSKVRAYVQCLGSDVVCTKGKCTAELRHMWGLDSVLRDDGLNLKTRDDHRHHAVDAIVIALTNRSRLQQLAAVRGTEKPLPEPWANFREHVVQAVNDICVSHRPSRRIAGALHEETIYGATAKRARVADAARPHAKNWIENDGVFVYRKRLEDLTPAMVDDIRDPQIRQLVADRLRQHGIEPGGKGRIPKEVWKTPLYATRKPGRTSTAPAVIKKVRLVKRDLTIQPIRQGTACVKPGNTHHIAIFDLPGSTPEKPKRDMVAVTMLEAVRRLKQKEPLISRRHPTVPNAKFVMSLSRGELVDTTIKGCSGLFVFRTASSTQGQIYFVYHSDARPSATAQKFVANANTLRARKVTVDVLGRVRTAND